MSTFQRKYVSNLVPSNTKVFNVILLAVAVINSATLGYDGSVMSSLNILPQYTEYFHLNTATTGLNNAAGWLGQIFAAFVLQPIPDRLGRKKAIVVSAAICFIGVILQAAAQNVGMFVVARIVVGFGSSISSAAAPTLIGELMPAKHRGSMLGIFFSCYYVGSLLSSIINYGTQYIDSTWAWRLPSLLMTIPSVIALLLLPFVPESPRWLVTQGRHEHAREVLTVVQGNSDPNATIVEETITEIESTLAREKELYPKNPWVEIISTRGNRHRLAILVLFGTILELMGNFVVSFYLGKILDQAGITSTNTQLKINVILNCWSFAVAILGSFALDIIGRRKQTLICIAGMTITLYMLAGLIARYGESSYTPGIYGTIVVIFLFQGFYAFSFTPMTSVYPMEISEYKIRTTGIAIFRFFDCAFGLMASFAMSYAMADLSWKFYIINASYNILFFIAVYFLFVETKGVSLEQIAILFDGPGAIGAPSSADISVQDEEAKLGRVAVSSVL